MRGMCALARTRIVDCGPVTADGKWRSLLTDAELVNAILSGDSGNSVTWTAPALAGGNFTISARATAGGVTATASVTITVDYEPLGVTLNASPGSTTIGREPIALTATVTGTHARDARIEWSNPEGRLSADEGPEVTFNPPNNNRHADGEDLYYRS